MSQDKNEMKEYWEARAKTFPAYNENDSYQTSVLDILKNHGVSFAGKHVLDLGCGSGSYALRIAKEALSVTALDISAGMLAKLSESASANGITNIKTVESDWCDFTPDRKYDVIFCSLTPALGTPDDVAKLKKYSAGWIVYITSKNSVQSDLLDALFALHNAERRMTVFKPVVREWLEENKVRFTMHPMFGVKTATYTRDEIIENCIESLRARKVVPDEAMINDFIEKFKTPEGSYMSKSRYDVEIYIWANGITNAAR